MGRCNSCNGVLTRTDSECFVCGEPVPGAKRRSKFSLLRLWVKSKPVAMQRLVDADPNRYRTRPQPPLSGCREAFAPRDSSF